MQTPIRGQEVAGGIYLGTAVLSLLLGAGVSLVQVGLGFALVFVKTQTASDALRLILFCWILSSVGVVLVAAVSTGVWILLPPVVMFGGGIAALMMEGMSGRKTLIPAAVAFVGAVLAVLLG